MRPSIFPILAALALLVPGRVAVAQGAADSTPPARRVAVTFDDLPFVARRSMSPEERATLTRRLVAAVRAARVPAIGFVNEGSMSRDGGVVDARAVALLRQWTAAGLELGNHTWGHVELQSVPVDSFVRHVVRGDSVTRLVLAERGRRPRWFRHPFLHTGRTLEDRAAVARALEERGYRVAPVTIDNYDYLYAAAYDDAIGSRKPREAARIADEYVAYMTRVVAYYEAQSRAIVGREIPQVLLLHANTLNAETFPRLARMLRGRGYAFASLDEATADPAYASRDEYTGPAGITWLHRWAMTRGLPGSTFRGEPEVPADIVAAAERD